jgi:alpha-beta hydrolase superfamily lysophospholipase
VFDPPGLVAPKSHGRRFGYAPGAPTVVLLHGLTATPQQFDALAPMLHARGRNVLVPRLPKHGYHNRMTKALAGLEVPELIAAVKLALGEARALGGEVTMAGFSLGGMLAAYAAQRERVDRAVCIAPFFGVRWLSRSLNRRFTRLLRFVPDLFLWWDPIRRGAHDGDGYPRYPISALRKAMTLGEAIFEDAKRRPPLTRSIALVTNPRETSCHNGLAHDLAELWRRGGAQVEEIELPHIRPSHDFMTPCPARGRERLHERVYPVVVEAIIG